MNKERYRKAIAAKQLLYKDKPCEYCGKEHDHTYGSGRFCSEECKIKYIADKNRGANNPKVKAHLDKLRAEGRVTPRKPYGTWKCKVCGEVLETRRYLNEHMHHVHGKNTTSNVISEDGKFKCPYCEKTFDKCLQAKGHLASCPKHPLKEMHDEAHKAGGRTYSKHYSEGKFVLWNQSHPHTLETR